MENEEWRDVQGYEGLYLISNFGNVFGIKRGKTLKLQNNRGYFNLGLSKNGQMETKKVHALVAESFIDRNYREKGLVVNHKNFIRHDNRLENLEVVTIRDNSNFKHIPSSSKYTGVLFDKKSNKWKSQIVVKDKQIYLGSFNDESEASKYYEDALMCVKNGDTNGIVVKRIQRGGYSFNKQHGKWQSKVQVKGKRIHLGYFLTKEEANKAYIEFNKKNQRDLAR